MMRIKLNLDKADPDYIVLFLTSLPGLEELRKNAKQAVNQASINQQDVKSVEIPLPSTKEQKEIVRIVEQLFANADKIETRYNKAKAQIDKLPQSLLAKAFRGELVAQDTNDESAGVLLERIRGEKQMQTKSKKKTKEYELAEEYSIAAEPKPTLRRIKK
jgi:type I restriction enzyme S subunit